MPVIRTPMRTTAMALGLGFAMALLAAPPARARNCYSELPPNLAEVSDFLAIGAELRGVYLGAAVGDGLPLSGTPDLPPWRSGVLLGLRPMVNLFATDDLTFILEPDLRFRMPGWEEKKVPHLDIRLNQVLVEYDPGKVRLTGGIQTLNYGTGALLDQRFVAFEFKLNPKPIAFTFFAGMTNRMLMKNAWNCGFMEYTSHTQGWKSTSALMNENFVLGTTVALKVIKPYRLKAMYLLSRPSTGELQSHSLALTFGGPLVKRKLSFTIEPLLLINHDGFVLPAGVVELRSTFAEGLDIRLGFAGSFRQASGVRFTPVYENLSWGMLQRYSLYEGLLGSAKASYQINDHVKPFARYFIRMRQANQAADERLGDELDAGVEIKISDLYKMRASYVGMNLAGPNDPTHMAYVELRVVLGSQLERKKERR